MGVKRIVVDNEEVCIVFTKDRLDLSKILSVDSTLAAGQAHLAKAVEVALESFKKGESLRNLRYEVYRRLLSIKEQRKLPLKYIEKEDCNVYLVDCEAVQGLGAGDNADCEFNMEKTIAVLSIVGVRVEEDPERLEKLLVAFTELTKLNRWLVD